MQDAPRNGSTTGSAGDARPPTSFVSWPLAAFGIWFASQLTLYVILAIFAGTGTESSSTRTTVLWGAQLANWTLVSVLVVWANRMLGGSAGDLGIVRGEPKRSAVNFMIGIGFGLLAAPMTILVAVLLRLVGLGGDTLAPYRAILAAPGGAVLLTVGAVVFAPVAEELFYRGFIQGRAVGERTGRAAVLPIVLVAAVFSLVHLNPAGALQLFLFGCLLGWLRQWRSDLTASIGAHVALNATTMVTILTGLAA